MKILVLKNDDFGATRWSPKNAMFFRDDSFIGKKAPNGQVSLVHE